MTISENPKILPEIIIFSSEILIAKYFDARIINEKYDDWIYEMDQNNSKNE